MSCVPAVYNSTQSCEGCRHELRTWSAGLSKLAKHSKEAHEEGGAKSKKAKRTEATLALFQRITAQLAGTVGKHAQAMAAAEAVLLARPEQPAPELLLAISAACSGDLRRCLA